MKHTMNQLALFLNRLFKGQPCFLLVCTLASWAVVARSLQYLFPDNAWVLNNDHLIPFDHLRLITGDSGISFGDLVLARIPSLFPDYILSWLVMNLAKTQLTGFQTIGLLLSSSASFR